MVVRSLCLFFFQAEDGIRDADVTGVQTCALPISSPLGQSLRVDYTPALSHRMARPTAGERTAADSWAPATRFRAVCQYRYREAWSSRRLALGSSTRAG